MYLFVRLLFDLFHLIKYLYVRLLFILIRLIMYFYRLSCCARFSLCFQILDYLTRTELLDQAGCTLRHLNLTIYDTDSLLARE